ncbi:MAG: hypothetical protein O6943_00520 [Bacteroidetes bacterium]|nr:hypothetical protein [Bacteroidota bacterium]
MAKRDYKMQLNDYAHRAKNILRHNTKYQIDKNIINAIFSETENIEDKVIARLSVIDSFYSTQMNKRLWGIEEICASINDLSEDDNEVKNLAIEFVDNSTVESKIFNLITKKYGYKKNGQPFGKASSLITKYLYFITNYQFPIYDSLVRTSYCDLQIRFPDFNLPNLLNDCDINFFHSIKTLNSVSLIMNYDFLDNLLWLYGKIKQGSFSLIFQQDIYLRLVSLAGVNNLKGNVDQAIRNYLQNHINEHQIDNLLSNDFVLFFNFCFENNAI